MIINLLVAVTLYARPAAVQELPTKGLLNPPCNLMIDSSSFDRDVMMLNCGCGNFVIASPRNLEGHVTIASPSDALRFVRLFTSQQTSSSVDLDGYVDVIPTGTTANGDIVVVAARYSQKALKIKGPQVNSFVVGGRTDFEITRCVVSIDGSVYEIREIVTAYGGYEQRSRTLLYRHSTDIGITHFGPL